MTATISAYGFFLVSAGVTLMGFGLLCLLIFVMLGWEWVNDRL